MSEAWVYEAYHPGYQLGLGVEELLFEANDGAQTVQVFENAALGRVLTLDGVIQVSTRDEFIYHEMIAHTPLFAHGAAERVLIIGGGDGGVLREVLKHQSVRQAVLVEIDRSVVELSMQWLPGVSDGAFDDPRTDIIIEDGATFVRNASQSFDVIIVDSTDPVGPGRVLFEPEFYADCRARLRPGGVLVCQAGTVFLDPATLRLAASGLGRAFDDVSAFLISTPGYSGGPLALGWASDVAALRTPAREALEARFTAADFKTRCYTPDTHLGTFALPPYIAEHLV